MSPSMAASKSAKSSKSPSCKNMIEFLKAIKGMPASYRQHFDAISRGTLEKVTNANAIGVWEVSDDLDGLFQLMEVFFKLKGAAASKDEKGWGSTTKSKSRKAMPKMVIISQEKKERNAYGRIVESMQHWTEQKGDKHLNGSVAAFESVIVVRGVSCDRKETENKMKEAVQRIDIAIEQVIKMTSKRSSSKIIWHHGPVLSLLLTWINFTSASHRNALSSITLAAPLIFTSGAKPSPHGRQNTPKDFTRLSEYATKLSIPVLLLDPITQLLDSPFPSIYMVYLGFYITLFLPPSVNIPHYHTALDALVTFAFALRAQFERKHGNAVVSKVKSHLNGERSQRWAKTCIDPSSYKLSPNRTASFPTSESSLNMAIALADCPWAPFASNESASSSPLPAFARVPISPASTADAVADIYVAAPIAFDFSENTFCVSPTTPFRVLVPRPGIEIRQATGAVQKSMSEALQRVRETKRLPKIGDLEAKMWNDAVGAISWALGKECVMGLEKGVKEKVECFGRGLVVSGCWGACVNGLEAGKKENEAGWSS
ncbi:unnamed protein product [Periconia digitata]|uniref:Uncharacterized protein n=1 Tax=Periconia digitata TaxID=1303443 RepID=A0A9W4XJJ8_9PLEO|nr:unnamed protein product [Periconia digitata]